VWLATTKTRHIFDKIATNSIFLHVVVIL